MGGARPVRLPSALTSALPSALPSDAQCSEARPLHRHECPWRLSVARFLARARARKSAVGLSVEYRAWATSEKTSSRNGADGAQITCQRKRVLHVAASAWCNVGMLQRRHVATLAVQRRHVASAACCNLGCYSAARRNSWVDGKKGPLTIDELSVERGPTRYVASATPRSARASALVHCT